MQTVLDFAYMDAALVRRRFGVVLERTLDTKGLAAFAQKYNEQWVHSGINNVTPWARFSGADAAICEARRVMLEKAGQQHPERWIGGRVMRCEAAGSQWLNPDRQITSLKVAA